MDFQKIPLESVKPSPMNPRKTFDDEAVRELAVNIGKQGLIQPITVRPCKYEDLLDDESGEVVSVPTEFEIVCGERRYRAYSLLKAKEDSINVERTAANRKKLDRFQSIPAMVREMTDEEAFEAMITENLQRQDVDPMEEAFAFGQLIKSGRTAEEVALKFGKSIRFIQDRCKLNSLIPELMVAVKEDKMSIAAAMIISKLDEDMQKTYHSQYSNNYQGFSKATAESFVNNLFMTISKAPWYKSDNQADEEFEGDCGCKCSECQLNTANHGCLFWEMKTQDAGRCTDRAKFQSKVLAYMMKIVEDNADNLVKDGQSLEKGKTVIAITPGEWCSEGSKKIRDDFQAKVESRGYEVVNPSIFKSNCWYDSDDERLATMLESGEVYRVLLVSGYDMPELTESFYYVNKNDDSVNSENGRPVDVNNLLREYQNLNNAVAPTHTVEGCKAIGEHGDFKELKGLQKVEIVLAYSLMAMHNQELCTDLGLGPMSKMAEVTEYVSQHLDMLPFILRSWLKKAIRYGTASTTLDEVRKLVEPHIDQLGELWCPTAYSEAHDKSREKYEKSVKKISGKLKKLGYDLDGNRLTEDNDGQD